MTRDEHFVGALTGEIVLTEAETARAEAGIDEYLVFAFFQFLELPMSQAKPPGFFVITRAIRYPVRFVGQRMQVSFQLRERHAPMQ